MLHQCLLASRRPGGSRAERQWPAVHLPVPPLDLQHAWRLHRHSARGGVQAGRLGQGVARAARGALRDAPWPGLRQPQRSRPGPRQFPKRPAQEPVPRKGKPEQPLEVFSYHKTVVPTNWKNWHETNMDPYHEFLHYINRRVAMRGDGYHERSWKIYPGGHATLSPMRQKYEHIKGWRPRDNKPMPGIMADEFRTVKIFPDTNIIARSTVMRIDTSTPISPGETLVELRGLGIKGESAEDRAMRVKHHNQFWGPFGRNLYEDAHAAECVSEVNIGGGGSYSILARHEGQKTQDDVLLRTYYQEWSRLMGRPAQNPKAEGAA